MNTLLLSFHFRRYFRTTFFAALFALLCLLPPGQAAAHRVTVFAWVEGETVYTESKFSGGKRVNGGDVVVYDLEGNQLLSGKTDEKGAFSFNMPKTSGMRIVLQAGMGHKGEWTIPAGENASQKPGFDPPASQGTPSGPSEPRNATPGVGLDEIRLVVEQSLDQRLGPVLKVLAERQDSGPTLRDILGGIGYIVGLMGLAAYIHFRRREGGISAKRKG
jgi:nickel transport protein